MKSDRPTVLITGASTGLGLVLTKKLIGTDSYNLVLTARGSSLGRFAGEGIHESPNIHIRQLDIASSSDRERIVSDCDANMGGIDLLINNAGVALRSVVEDASERDRIELLRVNYVGPMGLIALALPGMRRKRNGRIINISSAAGLVGMPTMACYCGSKFALEGATESLWYEARPWNIKVSLIIPGFIHSDSYQKTLTTAQSLTEIQSHGEAPYYCHYINMEKLISWMMKRTFATPESVAAKILKTMRARNPSLRVPATLDAWILFLSRRLLPRTVYHRLVFGSLPHSKSWARPATEGLTLSLPSRSG